MEKIESKLNNQEYNINYRDVVKINVQAVALFGLFIPDNCSVLNVMIFVLQNILFTGIIFGTLLTCEFIYLCKHTGSVRDLVDSSYMFLTHFMQLIKIVYFFSYNKRIKKLINSLDGNKFKPVSEAQAIYLQRSIQISKAVILIFWAGCVTAIMFWIISLNLEREKMISPIACWFPIKFETPSVFVRAATIQILAVGVCGVSNIAKDTLMAALISVISSQLHVLNDSLKNLRKHAELELKGKITNQDVVSPELQKIMDRKLLRCIHLHRHILEFAEEFTFLFTKSILGQLVVSVIIICTTLFTMTLVPFPSLNFVSLVFYQYCMLMEIFCVCYFGNEVILESNQLTNFAYHCDWVYCTKKFKDDLHFLMIRSQKILKIYAGGYFLLSLDTFVSILKSSWSYFAVLIQVNNDMA